MMTTSELQELKTGLRSLVVSDIGAAIKALREALPDGSPRFADALALEGQLNDANLNKVRGVVSTEELTLIYNRIRAALIELITSLEPADFETAPAGIKMPPDKTGNILYKIPGSMALEQESKCVIRLAFEEESLIRNIEITEDTSLKTIRISEVMDVVLLDPNSQPTFSIRTLSAAEQFVERGDYTEWIFFVTPLREGTFPLMLKVSVVEIVMGKERKKEIVLEENVQITTAAPRSENSDTVEGFKPSGYSLSSYDNEKGAPTPPVNPGSFQPPEPLPKTARSRSFMRPLMAAASILLIATVALTVYQQMDGGDRAAPDFSEPSRQEPYNPDITIGAKPSASYRQRIIGTWRTTDVTINSIAAESDSISAKAGFQATYQFFENGTFAINDPTGTFTGQFSIDESNNTITLQEMGIGLVMNGFIRELNEHQLTLELAATDSITNQTMTLRFIKID